MAIVVERLEAIIDVDSKPANRGIRKFREEWRGATADLAKFNIKAGSFRNIVKIMMIPTFISLISLAASAIEALAAGATALVAALGPLTGLLAAIPQGFALVAQGAGTVALAFIGVGKILKEMDSAGSMEELNKAMAQAGPSAAGFARFLKNNLIPEFQSLQKVAATALLPGLEQGVRAAMPLFDNIRRQTRATGESLARTSAQMGALFGSGAFKAKFDLIGESNVRIFDVLGKGVIYLTEGLMDLMVAARPLTEWMATAITNGAKWLSQTIKSGQETGRLNTFFQQAMSTTRMWGNLLKNLTGILVNVGKAAAPLGRALVSDLTIASARFRDLTSEAGKMASMRAAFMEFREPLRAAGRLVVALGRGFNQLNNAGALTNLMDALSNKLVPALVKLGQSANEAFGPKLIDALSNLSGVVATLMGHSGALTIFVQAISLMAKSFNALVGAVPGLDALVASLATMKGVLTIIKALGMSKVFSLMGLSLLRVQAGAVGATYGLRGMQAAAAGAAGGMRALLAAMGPVGIAIGVATAAWSIYQRDQKKAADESARVAAQLRKNFQNPDGLADRKAHIALLNEEIAKNKELARNPRTVKDIKNLENTLIRIKEQEKFTRVLEAQERSTYKIATATRTTTGSVDAFRASQRALGVTFKSSADMLAAYKVHLDSLNKASMQAWIDKGMEAKESMEKQAEAASQLRSSQVSLKEAQQATKDAVTRYNEALKPNEQALRAVRDATRELADAQRDLTSARKDAADNLIDLQFSAESALLAQERAVLSLEDSFKSLNKTASEATTEISLVTDDFTGKLYEVARITAKEADKREQESDNAREKALAQKEAQLALRQANLAVVRSQEALSEATRLGVEGAANVVAAHERISRANERLTEARKAMAESTKTQARAIKDAILEIEKAVIAEGKATVTVARLQAEMKGQVLSATDALKIELGVVSQLANSFGADSPLRKNLASIEADYRRQLGLMHEIRKVDPYALGADDRAAMLRVMTQWLAQNMKSTDTGNILAGSRPLTTAGRAHGGPVNPNRSYKVGEFGPEVLTMGRTGGVITPNTATNTNGITPQQMESIMDKVMAKLKPDVKIDQTFMEKPNPQLLARELAWRIA